jgi:hypothetical protein
MAYITREEVVSLMCETIDNMNIEIARQNNVPEEEIHNMIMQQRPHLAHANGLIYDALRYQRVIPQ